MRKWFLTLVLLVLALGAAASGMDVVTMVDTSESMFPYYDELVNYLLRDLLEHWLHKGDTFHLLSFADTPETEISARVTGPKELTAIIDRIYLLRALGQHTDLVAALDYLYAYLDALPSDSPKLVLLLTDGLHDPPPGSPNRGEAAQVLEALHRNADRIRLRGWDVHILRIPGAMAATAGGAATAGEAAEPLNLLEEFAARSGSTLLPYSESTPETLTEQLTGFPTLTFPGHLGKVGRRFTVPFTVTNLGPAERRLTLSHLTSGRARLLLRSAVCIVPPGRTVVLEAPIRLPSGFLPGEHVLPVRLAFAEAEVRVSPLAGELSFDYSAAKGISPVVTYILIAGGALLLLVAAVLVLLSLLRNRARDRGFERFFAAGRGGMRPLVLRVVDQNPYIGTRNIHVVPPGRSKSVGGDGSAFLIYYLPMPRRIGCVRNDGKQYIFIPRKPQYFASLDKPLAGCLNREIVALTRRGQRVRLVFQEYVSPLERINSLMRSVRRVRAQNASRAS